MCPSLCDPIDGSPPGSSILVFSRQEHWSGLPFPSPVPEREKRRGSRSVVSDSSRPHGLQPTRLLCPWDFPGKNPGVGCHFLHQGIFATEGSNLCLLHWRFFTSAMWLHAAAAAAAAKSLQSCPTLCDPIDGSPPGSPIPGILQARTLEWVAISFSNA